MRTASSAPSRCCCRSPMFTQRGIDVMRGLSGTSAWYWDSQRRHRGRSRADSRAAQGHAHRVAGWHVLRHYALPQVRARHQDRCNRCGGRADAQTPVNDMYAKNATLRDDGKLAHDFLLVTVKSKTESKGRMGLLQDLRGHSRERGLHPSGPERRPAGRGRQGEVMQSAIGRSTVLVARGLTRSFSGFTAVKQRGPYREAQHCAFRDRPQRRWQEYAVQSAHTLP